MQRSKQHTENLLSDTVNIDAFPICKLFEKTRIRGGFIEGDTWQKLLSPAATFSFKTRSLDNSRFFFLFFSLVILRFDATYVFPDSQYL